MRTVQELKLVEVCNHCGNSVALGFGRFVNRVPDFNDIETRVFYERQDPTGDFVCERCDNNSITENKNE